MIALWTGGDKDNRKGTMSVSTWGLRVTSCLKEAACGDWPNYLLTQLIPYFTKIIVTFQKVCVKFFPNGLRRHPKGLKLYIFSSHLT